MTLLSPQESSFASVPWFSAWRTVMMNKVFLFYLKSVLFLLICCFSIRFSFICTVIRITALFASSSTHGSNNYLLWSWDWPTIVIIKSCIRHVLSESSSSNSSIIISFIRVWVGRNFWDRRLWIFSFESHSFLSHLLNSQFSLCLTFNRFWKPLRII